MALVASVRINVDVAGYCLARGAAFGNNSSSGSYCMICVASHSLHYCWSAIAYMVAKNCGRFVLQLVPLYMFRSTPNLAKSDEIEFGAFWLII